MTSEAPQIAKDVRRLRADIQRAVRNFSNFHKRAVGEELRLQVRQVHRIIVRYWREPEFQLRWSAQLVHEIDMLKEDLEVAKEDEAFPKGFTTFEHLIRQAEVIGAQAGGMRKSAKAKSKRKQHPRGQDARGEGAGTQRAQRLSTHATPNGVYP